MLATFLIEIGFALFVLYRYKSSTIIRLVVALLVSLAIFQGAEYMLCGGFGIEGGRWSQLGYSFITLLPPLGLHLVFAIAGKRSRSVVPLAYLSAAVFVAYFAVITSTLSGHTCYANYAVFDIDKGTLTAQWYGLFYYGWLITAIIYAIRFARNASNHQKKALVSLVAGYSAFLIPTTVINMTDPSTLAGIPSIMCGFAVILAFILVINVIPKSGARTKV